MNDTIILPKPDDFHVHLRQGSLARSYLAREARWFGRAMVMPNTLPPVASGEDLARYRRELESGGDGAIELLMTFKILPGMSARTVAECRSAGAIAGKYYPAGATTNSSDGLSAPGLAEEALGAMEEEGLVLSIHAEDPAAPVLEREEAFLPVLEKILLGYPGLRIVFEHISTAAGIAFVLSGPERLAGTITAHHLLFTLDDVIGEAMDPHLHCKPVIKTRKDREALRGAVFSRNPRIFFGSDSAPHPPASKECGRAASGVYSAPTAIPALAGLFERECALQALTSFVAGAGAAFYGLPAPSGILRLVKRPWTVPARTEGVVPMLAGARLDWDREENAPSADRMAFHRQSQS